LTGEARRLVGEEVRRVNAASMAGERVVAVPVGPRASAPVVEDVDDLAIDDESVDDVVIDLDPDEDELAGDNGEGSVEDAEIISENEEFSESELVPLLAIPAPFRARFELGDAGGERARVAWSQKLRDEQRRRGDAEQAAEKADAEMAAKGAAARAARRADPGPAPSGWNSRGGRGRGPAGERAGG
jgi:hypothetical protein